MRMLGAGALAPTMTVQDVSSGGWWIPGCFSDVSRGDLWGGERESMRAYSPSARRRMPLPRTRSSSAFAAPAAVASWAPSTTAMSSSTDSQVDCVPWRYEPAHDDDRAGNT